MSAEAHTLAGSASAAWRYLDLWTLAGLAVAAAALAHRAARAIS